ARACCGGPDERGDRRPPVPERPDCRATPDEHLREAARLRQSRPCRGGRIVRPAAPTAAVLRPLAASSCVQTATRSAEVTRRRGCRRGRTTVASPVIQNTSTGEIQNGSRFGTGPDAAPIPTATHEILGG